MAETLTCPNCAAQVPSDAPGGVCPFCVLQLAGSEGSPAGWNATAPFPAVPSLPSREELAPLFPQLEILEFVGRGGMGIVYKARQPSLDRLVALKILLPDIGRDPTFAERFSREARALGRLNHPHVVAIYDSGHVGGLYYFVMEYVDGVNLRQAIQAQQISPEKALAIVPQICDALQYAHEEGVVHRDIKPENVLLDRKGRVKVADFGLAKLLGLSTPDISLTGTRQAMGTLHYMAPEQYEKPQSVDHRADIYSLGVVFYELLTGKLPLGRFALPSEKVQIDVRLDDVVLKSLEREPERRYQYVSEVKTEMDSIAHSPAPAARPLPRNESVFSPATPLPPPAQGITDFGRLLTILGILALATLPLLCVGSVLFSFYGVAGLSRGESAVFILGGGFLLLVGGVVLIARGLTLKRATPVVGALPPEKAPGAARLSREQAERAVRGPALALLILALVDIAASVSAAAIAFGNRPTPEMPIFVFILNLFTGMAIAIAATYMRRLQSHALAMTAAILALLPLHACWLLGVPIGIWALVVLCRSDVRGAFGIDSRPVPTGQVKSAGPVIAIVVILAGVMVLPLLCLGGLFFSKVALVREATPMTSTEYIEYGTHPEPPKMVSNSVIAWSSDKPYVNRQWSQLTRLNQSQLLELDAALEEAHSAYVEVEKQHTEHKLNDEGHEVVTIGLFAKELSGLENKLWTKIDDIVTDNQLRGQLREQLQVRPELFPFGSSQQSIHLWKVGQWYYYQWDGYGQSPSKGPELPQNVKRFWQEPETKQ